MIKLIFVVASLLATTIFVPSTYAEEPCSPATIRSMIEQGLSDEQIDSICKGAEKYQGAETQEEDLYTKADRLYAEHQIDELVKLLDDYCRDNPYDHKVNMLFANALLEQVEAMKAKRMYLIAAVVLIPLSVVGGYWLVQ